VATSKEKDFWPIKAAVVITRANQNIGMVLRELLRNYNWTVCLTTPSIDTAISCVRSGEAIMIIVDDSPDLPASLVLRCLLADPIASMIPTLVLIAPTSRNERPAITNLGRPFVVDKPLTPNRFVPGFKSLVSVWSSGQLNLVRQAVKAFIAGNEETGLKLLTKLTAEPTTRIVVASALSNYCLRSGNIKTAEKILLTALKTAPRNLGLILALADFYLHAAMPAIALRLVRGAETTYGQVVALLVDRLQIEMMSLNFDAALKTFNDLQARNFMPNDYQSYLARILFSDGRQDLFLKTLGSNAKAEKFEQAWETPPKDPAPESTKDSFGANTAPEGDPASKAS
jgi:hypothetical protein